MLLLLLASARAATLDVGPAETYTTIAAALDAANAGDTVQVHPGTYAEDLDLRGLSVNVVSTDGPSRTTLSPATLIYIDGGSLEGFRVSPAPTYGVTVTSGSPTLRDLVIEDSASYGVYITTGTPLVEDVVVRNAGLHAFIAKAGTPTIRHSVSWNAVNTGFAIQTNAVVENCIAVGGATGFKNELAAATLSHLLAIGQTSTSVYALTDMTVRNSVFYDGAALLKCSSGVVATLPNGISYPTLSYSGCATGTTIAVDILDPQFTLYDAAYDLQFLNLSPAYGSPMIDAADDLDPDGSTGDLGPFGGPSGDWSDRDGDNWPDVFDCDDRVNATHAYASEIGDGEDNDCDGIIDEDVPVDTGDTGDSGDTGVIDTAETGDSGTIDTFDSFPDSGDTSDTSDTGEVDPGTVDLDGDGFTAAVDCDEHNKLTWPGADEIPDHADNDCDSLFDEGTALGDSDGDGYTLGGGDCNDLDPTVYPGLDEPPGSDGLDQNCNGVDDYGRAAVDTDLDGYAEDVDCDDTDASVHPGAHEDDDLFDNDCDGRADEDTIDADRDSDGVTPSEGDCDDHDSGFGPNVSDTPDDFLDQDCTGTDNYDIDRDGNPAPASGGTDCDDTRSTVNPAAEEICGDGVDNNCDGGIDDICGKGDDTGVVEDPDECGCASTNSSASAAAFFVTLALLTRRRRGSLATRS